MCLLINQPKNTARIDTGKLSTAYDSNPDGVGFAYGDGKRVHILKFRDLKTFLSEYKKTVVNLTELQRRVCTFTYHETRLPCSIGCGSLVFSIKTWV